MEKSQTKEIDIVAQKLFKEFENESEVKNSELLEAFKKYWKMLKDDKHTYELVFEWFYILYS